MSKTEKQQKADKVLYKAGDSTRGICHVCKDLVDATFQVRDLPIEGGGTVKAVLATVCDRCGTTIGFPGQSLEEVQAAVRLTEAQLLETLNEENAHVDELVQIMDEEWLGEGDKGSECGTLTDTEDENLSLVELLRVSERSAEDGLLSLDEAIDDSDKP